VTDPPIAPTSAEQPFDGQSWVQTPSSETASPSDGPLLNQATPNAKGRATGVLARHSRHLLEWVVVVVLAVLAAAGLRAFVMQAFFVPSGSMQPTLQVGDRIIVVKVGYTIHRGDIIVFRRTPADTSSTIPDLVKRVIGLPGETISSRGTTVLINGTPIKEPWLPRLTGICAEAAENIPTTKIPPGHYFMMGDCRGDSADSRMWGTLPASYVVGKVVFMVWRFGHPYFHWF
jgi:signal peptidase I